MRKRVVMNPQSWSTFFNLSFWGLFQYSSSPGFLIGSNLRLETMQRVEILAKEPHRNGFFLLCLFWCHIITRSMREKQTKSLYECFYYSHWWRRSDYTESYPSDAVAMPIQGPSVHRPDNHITFHWTPLWDLGLGQSFQDIGFKL